MQETMDTTDLKDLKDETQHMESVVDGTPLEDLDSIEQTRTGRFSWMVSITAAIGGMLFGYDTGIISAVLVYIHQDLGHTLDSSERELITPITSGGAFVGAIFAGATADRFGRKIAIYVGCFLFTAGAILQAAAFSLALMTVGRLVVGLGVGSAAMIIPMYIAELSPAKYRGRMIGLDNMCITGGQLVSYGIGAGFAHVRGWWRQLVFHGRREEAEKVIRKIFPNGTDEQVRMKVRHITAHVDEAKNLNAGKSQWWVLKQLYVVPANLRALVSACGVMAISQLSGFNSLMYYSPLIFSLVDFNNPVVVGTIIAGTNFFFTFVNLLLVNRVGRRRILLCTVQFMGLFLVVAAVAFKWISINHDLSLGAGATVGPPAIIVLVSMVFFVGFYSSGFGNTAWLSSEFFPIEVRAMGTMMLTMTCWGSNVIVASTFLTQMENTTPSGAFGFYAAVCVLGWVSIYFCYLEVKNMTLENIREVFAHGFGVKRARELQKQMESTDRRLGLVSTRGVKV
ncbi:myo-inositol transporter [Colletotrichum plurivorum]|uniref:Myo-inositol transporter n=1 Tax=Colletotrichum plurivorum TaxID=2175906 RepID=A0A8H6N7R8_9PEZI|nr:myo-inositol transporter [Colletotrichum plurivorum]